MKKKQLFSLVLTAAVFLSACSTAPQQSGSSPETSETDTTLRLIYAGEAETLNYLKTDAWNDAVISANTIDCLVDYDTYGNIIPGLAESWTSSDDMKTWTFTLRSDIHWLDWQGQYYADVTADDWVAAAEYVNNAVNDSHCRYIYSTGSVIKNAEAYYNFTASQSGISSISAEKMRPEDIGVSAPDSRTLVFTLEQPCPFFLSVLSYTAFMPVCRSFLRDCGDSFACDNQHLLYNGAYILSEYVPGQKQILTASPDYWDSGNVHLERIERIYDPDAYTVQGQMYLSGQIDRAQIGSDMLEAWMSDRKTRDLVHPSRPNGSFSYFYAFNFDPSFGSEYEPENWRKAVANEHFRMSLACALDTQGICGIYDPYDPERLVTRTVTPYGFASVKNRDYTESLPLSTVVTSGMFDRDRALREKERALKELENDGVELPVKVLMPYNPSVINWDIEASMVECSLEETLGTDYIDIIAVAGPETGFLSKVRRSGAFAFMKCNWGADYTDPLTWTNPFAEENSYVFWDKSSDSGVRELFDRWKSLVDDASVIFDNDDRRFNIFAQAEDIIIEHAVAVPCNISVDDGYVASKLDPFEGEYAPNGVADLRYKRYTKKNSSMSRARYDEALKKWEQERKDSGR